MRAAPGLPDYASPFPTGPPVLPGSIVPNDAENDSSLGLSIPQVLAILRAHLKWTILIWVCVTLAAAAVIKLLPKTYTATATLIVDPSNRDPLAAREAPVSVLENYVATQTELIQSPVVLLPVVDRLHLTENEHFTAGFRGAEPNALREYVQKSLSLVLQVDIGRGSQLIYVSASARDPVLAATIANAVIDQYMQEERHRIDVPATERAQRYAERLADLRAKVAEAQEKVAAFRQQKEIIDLTATKDSESQALQNLESKLLEAQNLRRSLEARRTGDIGTTNEALASSSVQHLDGQLHSLDEQLVQLRSTYGPRHPKVLELESRIAATRASLASETQKLQSNTLTELARARALETKYAQAVTEQRAKVVHLRELQGQGAKLELELGSAQSVYKRALDGYDQVLFASTGNHTDVSVVNRATPPVRTTKPKKTKLFLAAIVGALGVAVALPFLYELLLARRIRCRDDLERTFAIPVLAELERFATPSGAG